MSDSTSGSPPPCRTRPPPTWSWSSRVRTPTGSTRTRPCWAKLFVELGALEIYVLPAHAAGQLISAREKAFFVAKAAGADDIIDAVVPRAAIPAFLAAAAEAATAHGALVTGCGHVGDGNVHLSVFQPDVDRRYEVLHAIFRAGQDLGGTISGEHGVGTEKKRYSSSSRIRSRWHSCDGSRMPSIPTEPRPRHSLRPVNGAQRLIRTLVAGDVNVAFMNPGTSEMQFVAALDDVPEMRAILGLSKAWSPAPPTATAAWPAGRPPPCCIWGRARERDRQSAQRPPGPHPAGERRGRPRHLPPALRPAPGLGHREPGPTGLVVVPGVDVRRRAWRPTRSPPWPPPGAPRRRGHPGGAGRCHGPKPAIRWRRRPRWRRGAVGHGGGRRGAPRPCGRVSRPCSCSAAAPPDAAALLAASRVAAAAGPSCVRDLPGLARAGAGLPAVERLGYLAEFTLARWPGARHLVLVDALAPVSFFAYPGIPGYLVPEGCEVHVLADPAAGEDVAAALEESADILGAPADGPSWPRPGVRTVPGGS